MTGARSVRVDPEALDRVAAGLRADRIGLVAETWAVLSIDPAAMFPEVAAPPTVLAAARLVRAELDEVLQVLGRLLAEVLTATEAQALAVASAARGYRQVEALVSTAAGGSGSGGG